VSKIEVSDDRRGDSILPTSNDDGITSHSVKLGEAGGGTRYFARYNTVLGRKLVQDCAHRIFDDQDDTDYTIFEAPSLSASGTQDKPRDEYDEDDIRGGCVLQLLHNPQISQVEEDHQVVALAKVTTAPRSATMRRSEWAESIVDMGRRKLESAASSSPKTKGQPMDDIDNEVQGYGELASWGIEAIQAKDLELGEYSVTVCVVDTGLAPNHPDFNYSKISGRDRDDRGWAWNEDRVGHGTHNRNMSAILLCLRRTQSRDLVESYFMFVSSVTALCLRCFCLVSIQRLLLLLFRNRYSCSWDHCCVQQEWVRSEGSWRFPVIDCSSLK
jgi:hypothetical protein